MMKSAVIAGILGALVVIAATNDEHGGACAFRIAAVSRKFDGRSCENRGPSGESPTRAKAAWSGEYAEILRGLGAEERARAVERYFSESDSGRRLAALTVLHEEEGRPGSPAGLLASELRGKAQSEPVSSFEEAQRVVGRIPVGELENERDFLIRFAASLEVGLGRRLAWLENLAAKDLPPRLENGDDLHLYSLVVAAEAGAALQEPGKAAGWMERILEQHRRYPEVQRVLLVPLARLEPKLARVWERRLDQAMN